MELCIATNFLAEPCPYTATIGDYCILHAGGWDYFKANAAMLWSVHGRVTTLLGIVTGLGVIVGSAKVFNLARDGEPRSLNLAEMKDSAETLIRILDLLSQMDEQDMEDQRNRIENVGKTVLRLQEDVQLLIQHMAVSYHAVQSSAEEMAGSDSV